MYDVMLMEDVKNYKIGAHTYLDREERIKDIKKIITTRTKDKIWLLNYALKEKIINQQIYNECYDRAIYDFKISHLYIMGQITKYELENNDL